MSLLMDALRRAEAERRQQAARTAGQPGAAQGGPEDGDITRIAPLQPEPAPEPAFTLQAPPVPDGVSGHSLFDELTLEPLDELNETESPDRLAALDALEDALTGPDDATLISQRERGLEQTATLPSTRSRHQDLDAYFDPSQTGSAPRAAAAAAGAVDMTLEDVASHTLVGARTVFTASERPRSNRVFVGAGIFIVLLTLTIAFVVVFYARQSAPPALSSPAVASGVEKSVVRELPVVPLDTPRAAADPTLARVDTSGPAASPAAGLPTTAATAALATTPPETARTAAPVPPPDTPPASDPAPVPLTTGVAPAEITAPVSTAPPPASPASAPAPAPAVRPAPAAPVAAMTAPLAAAPVADVGAGELRIVQRRATPAVDRDIAAGYAALQSGDLAAAEARYAAALARQPRSRDALLGLGATALRQGNAAQAYRHYVNLLEHYPGDPLASAALVSLSDAGGEGAAARLKLLLDEHPDLAVLHFALGNWYARQQRWSDAQQAYFDAMRLDDRNADYVFNLAISLDRLGQGKAALGYYQKSLTLADSAGASFNPADALARIGSLNAVNTP